MKNDYIKALLIEIKLQTLYLGMEKVDTIYFGGGTPSILESDDLKLILEALQENYTIQKDSEITLESNPDDITSKLLIEWSEIGINRLSIGTQSFIERDLLFMERAHSAKDAEKSILLAAEHGFNNITIDLIYGTPNLTYSEWIENVKKAFSLPIQHLSCYALTVEEDTKLFHQIRKGKTAPIEDKNASRQFDILMKMARENGFEHYEISNFCKEGFISKHNSSYWQNKKYLGLGPSAHSFNGMSRKWNLANNKKYIDHLMNGELIFETENLTESDKINEYIMTGLRTKWGIDLEYIQFHFSKKKELLLKIGNEDSSMFDWEIKKTSTGNSFLYRLSDKGKHFADRIASNLFF